MNFLDITLEYYSQWCDIDISSLRKNEVRTAFSSERNHPIYGYTNTFDLIIFYQNDNIIVSYGDKLSKNIGTFADNIKVGKSIQAISDLTETYFGKKPNHGIKFVYNAIPEFNTTAEVLKSEDYPLYLDFYIENYPNCNKGDCDWLKEYFDRNAESGYFCAIFRDGKIVSCTDSPGMPYMENKVQEVGINTLPQYRGKGYAKDSCITAVKNIINNNKCPQWSTSINNIASQKLAYSVGFEKLADTLILTL